MSVPSIFIFSNCEPTAAAAAKSLQSCPTLCPYTCPTRDPIDGSPPGSPIPGILQARTLEWVGISFSSAWKWKVKGKSCLTLHDPMVGLPTMVGHTSPSPGKTAAYQAPPSMGFSKQEYWSGVNPHTYLNLTFVSILHIRSTNLSNIPDS